MLYEKIIININYINFSINIILLFLKSNCSKKTNNLKNDKIDDEQIDNQIEHFKSIESLCEEYPPLAEVNYTLNDPLKVKQDKTYYIKDDNSNEKYKFIIENVQPFEDLYDDILEIKQSENYVWVLNRGRNRLVKSERLKIKHIRMFFNL